MGAEAYPARDTVQVVLDEFNFGDGVVNAGDKDAEAMAHEIAHLRFVLRHVRSPLPYPNVGTVRTLINDLPETTVLGAHIPGDPRGHEIRHVYFNSREEIVWIEVQ